MPEQECWIVGVAGKSNFDLLDFVPVGTLRVGILGEDRYFNLCNKLIAVAGQIDKYHLIANPSFIIEAIDENKLFSLRRLQCQTVFLSIKRKLM